MQIKRHLLFGDDGTPVAFVASQNQGGALTPSYLVMHFTGGAGAESSIAHLTRKGSQASAHLVIARDGTITQLVPFNRIAWHAGASRWRGLQGLNKFSIGIELDNAGELSGGPGHWKSWFGRAYPDEQVVVAAHQHDGIESGWHDYPEAQLTAAIAAAEAIASTYDLLDVVGHDDIAPDRKRDPGPAFPMERFRSRIMGRAEDALPIVETVVELNVRSGPGVEFDKLLATPLAKGARLALRSKAASWCAVEVLDANDEPTLNGWVYGDYVRPV